MISPASTISGFATVVRLELVSNWPAVLLLPGFLGLGIGLLARASVNPVFPVRVGLAAIAICHVSVLLDGAAELWHSMPLPRCRLYLARIGASFVAWITAIVGMLAVYGVPPQRLVTVRFVLEGLALVALVWSASSAAAVFQEHADPRPVAGIVMTFLVGSWLLPARLSPWVDIADPVWMTRTAPVVVGIGVVALVAIGASCFKPR